MSSIEGDRRIREASDQTPKSEGRTMAEMRRAIVDLYKQNRPIAELNKRQNLWMINYAVSASLNQARRIASNKARSHGNPEGLSGSRLGKGLEYDEANAKQIIDHFREITIIAKKGGGKSTTPQGTLREEGITPELVDQAWENLFPPSKS